MVEAIERLPYWDALDENERKLLRGSAVLRRYESGSRDAEQCNRNLWCKCEYMLFILSIQSKTNFRS